MIRVVIVDDHAVVRSGLQSLLDTAGDIDVVGAAADGAAAIELVANVEPDVVLMDLSMRGMDGVAATAAITKAHSDVSVVVLTSFSEPARITAALEAGGSGTSSRTLGPTSSSPQCVPPPPAALRSTRARPESCSTSGRRGRRAWRR